jgi:type IV secretory pathway TrbD component
MTQAFAVAELALLLSIVSLALWLAPKHADVSWMSLLTGAAKLQTITLTLGYAAAVAFVEPFYVAAGFGMYLNRRVELEAWDIEQEFRRAFSG